MSLKIFLQCAFIFFNINKFSVLKWGARSDMQLQNSFTTSAMQVIAVDPTIGSLGFPVVLDHRNRIIRSSVPRNVRRFEITGDHVLSAVH